MSLDIPSYYYTDVGKRVKGESSESLRAKIAKAGANFNDAPTTRLDAYECINLDTAEGRASVHISDEARRAIEESNKHLGKMDFNAIERKCPEYEVIVNNREGRPLDYYKFENCVNGMTELDDKQKTTLRNAIITSTESADGKQQDSNTFGMRISQTNMELKYICQKLVPEKYQDQFNSIVDKYTDGLTDKYTNLLETFDTAFANTTDQSLITSGWKKKAKESLDALKNGTDEFHESKNLYDNLYKNLDMTNDDKLKEGLSSVYDNFMAAEKSDQTSLVREVKYLSEKWNAVVSEMNGSNSLKFTTSINCVG